MNWSGWVRVVAIAVAVAVAVAILLAASESWSESVDDSIDPARVIAAERAFASASIERGMKDAFLGYLASDGIVFRPGPVPGLTWFRRQPPSEGRLEWAPDWAAIATSGDFGFTAGPWRWQAPNGDARFGHYVTVWRVEGGQWKVAIDGGASHAPVDLEVEPEVPSWSDAREREDERLHGHAPPAIGGKSAVLEADRKLTADIEQHGWKAAFERWAADDVRWYRPGALPVVGKAAVVAGMGERGGALRCSPLGGDASAGDLGYSYGTGQFAIADSVVGQAYLRIWRMTHDGKRVVVVESSSAMPAVATGP